MHLIWMTSNFETLNNKNDFSFYFMHFSLAYFLFKLFYAFHIYYYCKIMRQHLKNEL